MFLYIEETKLGPELAIQSYQWILQGTSRVPYNRLTIYPNRWVRKCKVVKNKVQKNIADFAFLHKTKNTFRIHYSLFLKPIR